MAYSPALDDPISRVRFGVGDIGAEPFLPDTTYEALLLIAADDEAVAIRSAAAALAAKFANEPDQISDDGSTISWRKRVDQWNLIALGKAGGAQLDAANDTSLSYGMLSLGFQETDC